MRIFLILTPIFPVLLSCEPTTESGSRQDTVVVNEEEEQREDRSYREEIKEEREQLDRRLDSLETRVESAVGEAKAETREAIERLKRRRDQILNDTTEEKLENEWKEFRTEVDNILDSLEKQLK